MKNIAIIGTVGVPGNYGGFETLAENLARYHSDKKIPIGLAIYCSAPAFSKSENSYLGANLRYLPLRANGVHSIAYDVVSMLDAIRRRDDVILALGVSGAICIPIVRVISKIRIVTNIDGIEWKRKKWNSITKVFLRWSEWLAIRYSHVVISDNAAIADYIDRSHGRTSQTIAYGGDHAVANWGEADAPAGLPAQYALALCRIEPENNVHVILEALADHDIPLVFVGNWHKSEYGSNLRASYKHHSNLHLIDPVYEPRELRALRARAIVYLHGHSAGGTNPSLVEMMHFSVPILAYDCSFNRHTTEDKALYFNNSNQLARLLHGLNPSLAIRVGRSMHEIAQRRYTWDQVGKAYFDLLDHS